jgi:hypothetical protein
MEKTVRSRFAAIRPVFPLTRGYRTELVRELRSADASDIAKHPIAHMPVVSDADYLSVLFSIFAFTSPFASCAFTSGNSQHRNSVTFNSG